MADPQHPDIDEKRFLKCDWHNFYRGAAESIPGDAPVARGNVVSTHCFVDADHAVIWCIVSDRTRLRHQHSEASSCILYVYACMSYLKRGTRNMMYWSMPVCSQITKYVVYTYSEYIPVTWHTVLYHQVLVLSYAHQAMTDGL